MASRVIPAQLFIRLVYKRKVGHFPNLQNPQLFTEKIQWLKLHDRTKFHTICADKYAVRNYISKEFGDKYLIPLVFRSLDVNDLSTEKLPDYPFIIKTNHDSEGSVIVFDKAEIEWSSLKSHFQKKLNTNYYYLEKEWQYKNIPPCLLIEKLILNESNCIPKDYKVYCFNGTVKLIQVDEDRGKESHFRIWYDQFWNKKEIIGIINNPFTKKGHSSNRTIERPQHLSKMIEFSEKIAKHFHFVRVDWYDTNGQLLFGEITFHPSGGFHQFVTREWDISYGKLLKLSTN